MATGRGRGTWPGWVRGRGRRGWSLRPGPPCLRPLPVPPAALGLPKTSGLVPSSDTCSPTPAPPSAPGLVSRQIYLWEGRWALQTPPQPPPHPTGSAMPISSSWASWKGHILSAPPAGRTPQRKKPRLVKGRGLLRLQPGRGQARTEAWGEAGVGGQPWSPKPLLSQHSPLPRSRLGDPPVRSRAGEGGVAVGWLLEVSKAAGVIAHPKHRGAPPATHWVLTGQLIQGLGQRHVVAIRQQPRGGWDLSQCLGTLEVPGGCRSEGQTDWGRRGGADGTSPQPLAVSKASSPGPPSLT